MSRKSLIPLSERRQKYTGIYASWYAMKGRCNNPNNSGYKNYGGRGISYTKNWESFEGFKTDMGDNYKRGLTLERIDNNSNYSIDNCRWATRKEQNNNKRSNIVLTFRGETMPIAIWAEKLSIGFDTIRSRFYRGMSVEEVLKSSLYRPAKLTV